MPRKYGAWMKKWDDREKREEFSRKIGKFMVISAVIGLGYYLAIYF